MYDVWYNTYESINEILDKTFDNSLDMWNNVGYIFNDFLKSPYNINGMMDIGGMMEQLNKYFEVDGYVKRTILVNLK